MAKYLIARQLSGKKVVTNDGEDFGRLVDIDVNEISSHATFCTDESCRASSRKWIEHVDGLWMVLQYLLNDLYRIGRC